MGLDHNHLPTHADLYNLFTCTSGYGSEFFKLVSYRVNEMQSSKLRSHAMPLVYLPNSDD